MDGSIPSLEHTPSSAHPNSGSAPGRHTHTSTFSRHCMTTAIRFTTGHAFTGDYARRFLRALPAQSHSCPCGAPIRTSFHLLYQCPRYLAARFTSGIISQGRTKTFRSLFHTKAGARSLLTFLSLSRAAFHPEEGPLWDTPRIDQLQDPN